MIEFNESRHEYKKDGVIIPSVTQSIGMLYAGAFEKIPPAVLEYKTAVGSAVHLATQYHDEGCLDYDGLDDVVRGYVDGYLKFLAENKCEWSGIETLVYHPVHRYAGRLDRKGRVNGEFYYVDLKCVAHVSKVTGPQLAGYQAADEHTLPFFDRMAKPKRMALRSARASARARIETR